MKNVTRASRRTGVALPAALLALGLASAPAARAQNPCAPRATNPCAPRATNPCAAKSANPCAAKPANPCAAKPANPCAAKAHNPCHPRRTTPAAGDDLAGLSSIDHLLDEFLAASAATAGRPGAEEPARFPGPEGRPDWFQLLVVTRAENPLLEEECKREAFQLSVDRFAAHHGIEEEREALRAAAEHIRMHQEFVTSHGISYSGYLHEIAECHAFCAPVVASLIQCQVLSVARNPHGIVLFDLDSDRVDLRYENGALENILSQLEKDPERKVALIGRASRIGDLRYNRGLSARRALAVRDSLIELGAPPERVETMWFGWEPPQLSAWIADEYGMRDLFETEGELRMNQSVVAVVY